MKRMIAMALCLVLALGLAACSTDREAQQQTTAGTTGTTGATVSQTETTGPETAQDAKALAESCIGKSVEELYALIGQPESSEYAPSCLNPGEGEDGLLYYADFVVYTYKDANGETVDYVE